MQTQNEYQYLTNVPVYPPSFQYHGQPYMQRPQMNYSRSYSTKQQLLPGQSFPTYVEKPRSLSLPDTTLEGNLKGPSKADKRAEHNAIERARRESLNSKFQELAHALPTLQSERRPSKSRIIELTLDFVQTTLLRERQNKAILEKLEAENRKLRDQVTKTSKAAFPVTQPLYNLDTAAVSSMPIFSETYSAFYMHENSSKLSSDSSPYSEAFSEEMMYMQSMPLTGFPISDIEQKIPEGDMMNPQMLSSCLDGYY